MTPDESCVRLTLELTSAPDQISGQVSRPGQPAVAFAGWIGLLVALDTLRKSDACADTPDDSQPDAQA